ADDVIAVALQHLHDGLADDALLRSVEARDAHALLLGGRRAGPPEHQQREDTKDDTSAQTRCDSSHGTATPGLGGTSGGIVCGRSERAATAEPPSPSATS